MKEFKTIGKKEYQIELIEKKSRFIAHTYYVESVQEAEEKIKNIKKKYYDARHNCYAYRIIQEEQILQKSSDDGEPQGTAGAPILGVLEKNKLENVLIIVTRYFGGILLGTGGLVKAYSESTIQVINEAGIIKMQEGLEMKITIPYSDFASFKYFCNKEKIKIEKEEYLENIIVVIELSEEKERRFFREYKELGFKIIQMEKNVKKLIRKN